MMKRILILLLALLLGSPAYAQQWDRVNGSMQVKSGPSTPLVIIDQTNTTADSKALSIRAAGTEKCSIDIDGDLVCTGTFTIASLSATRVPFSSTGGLLVDNSGFTFTAGTQRLLVAGGYSVASVMVSGTAPTVPVACTTPTVVNSNGTAAFEIDVGSTCAGVTTLVVTMPAVTNSYHCTVVNLTTGTMAPEMTAATSTSITITNFQRTTGLAADWADGANVSIGCTGR